MHDAFAVAQHLHFEVARALEETFEIEGAAAERGRGLGLRRRKMPRQPRLVVGDADAAAAAAGARLEHDRVADVPRRGQRVVEIGDLALAPRHDRHAGGLRRRPRRRLVTHGADRFR